MTYATGSGDYVALMAAILAFASSDGWTLTGGGGTTWPISKGNVRGVDWSTDTFTAFDFTNGSPGGSFTARNIRIGLGTTPALATTQAATATSLMPNASFAFSEWHIFSDPASGTDYIHVAARFNNSAYSDNWAHISFGEVDKQGMGYTGIAYAAALNRKGWANDNTGSPSAGGSWNTLNMSCAPFAGEAGSVDDASLGISSTSYIIQATSPVTAASGYPAVDTVIEDGTLLFDASRIGQDITGPSVGVSGSGNRFSWNVIQSIPMPLTGAVSFAPLPFILANGTAVGNRITWCGAFPGVRQCSMQDFNPADIVTFSSEDWMLFPFLRKTDNSFLNTPGAVTSGPAGLAYKRVA